MSIPEIIENMSDPYRIHFEQPLCLIENKQEIEIAAYANNLKYVLNSSIICLSGNR